MSSILLSSNPHSTSQVHRANKSFCFVLELFFRFSFHYSTSYDIIFLHWLFKISFSLLVLYFCWCVLPFFSSQPWQRKVLNSQIRQHTSKHWYWQLFLYNNLFSLLWIRYQSCQRGKIFGRFCIQRHQFWREIRGQWYMIIVGIVSGF